MNIVTAPFPAKSVRHARAEVARSTNSAAEENSNQVSA